MKLHSLLPHDRALAGTLWATDDAGVTLFGPVRCRGKADSQIAAVHGNPTRDPVRPFGDHPTGSSRVVAIERDKELAPHSSAVELVEALKRVIHSYGPAFILLGPVSGQAWEARQNGRQGLAIHGGDLQPDGTSLRATEGCLRADNAAVEALAELLETERTAGREVFYDCEEAAA